MGDEVSTMEIYVRNLIQYESERSVLREIERLLSNDQRSAIVFANISNALCHCVAPLCNSTSESNPFNKVRTSLLNLYKRLFDRAGLCRHVDH